MDTGGGGQAGLDLSNRCAEPLVQANGDDCLSCALDYCCMAATAGACLSPTPEPFKAESELSSFGEQVERYACLYTDRVTKLLGYSGSHFFRGPRSRMAHEQ